MTGDAPGNALADQPVIVYNKDGSINRESFGRDLSRLERALCDALDKRTVELLLADEAITFVADNAPLSAPGVGWREETKRRYPGLLAFLRW